MKRGGIKSRRGAAAVELAIVLPLLAFLLFGVLEVGQLLNVQTILENSAGVGGRMASSGVSTNAEVQQAIIKAVTNNLKSAYPSANGENVAVTVENLTNPSLDVSQATQLDKLRITVSIPFRDVRWVASGIFFTDDATRVSARAFYCSARVNPYPTDIQPPPGY
jgi:Flp pilus assembly protein TadG